MYDIIIIGGGIAGLTAAIYSARAQKRVLLIDKSYYGGQIVNSPLVENYPGVANISGFELANTLYQQVKKLNVEFKFEEVIKIEKNKIITKNQEYITKTIIIATGTINRKLELSNEDKYIGKGISYCATCDGSLYKDKTVAVVGGGNTALEEAIYLSDIAKKVYLIHRNESLKGEAIYQEQLRKKFNVEIILNEKIININGNDLLESIELQHNTINIDGLFIAIGKIPNTKLLVDLIELNENGYVKSNEECKTNITNIFVAGDVREKNLRQLITAASDGAIAATNAIKYLHKDE